MCVCVCVFWRSLCSNFFFSNWEIILWIGSLVELYVGLHSRLCFSPLEKLFWKAGSTPSRNLVDWLRMLLPPWHLVDRLSFCSWIWFLISLYLLDTSVVDDLFLDTCLDSFLNTSRYLICWAFLKVLFKPPSRSVSHFLDLSRSVCAYSSPKHSFFHSQPLPQGFFKLFQLFLHLVSF